MAEVGRALSRPSAPAGPPEQAAQDQVPFECPQAGRLYQLSEQPKPNPHSEVFPDTQREPPVFQFALNISCPVTVIHMNQFYNALQ